MCFKNYLLIKKNIYIYKYINNYKNCSFLQKFRTF